MKKPAVTEVPIHPLIAERWSGRAFDETKTVTREQVLSLLGGRVLFRSRTVNLGEGFQPQGSAKQLRSLVGLDAESLARTAKEVCQ